MGSVRRYQKGEVLQLLVEDFTTSEFRDPVHEVFQNALAGKQTDNFEFPLYTKDGKCVTILLNASPRTNRDGAVPSPFRAKQAAHDGQCLSGLFVAGR